MIIQSLLDTDLYKFTMMQVVLHHFPGAQVEYRFKCFEALRDLSGQTFGYVHNAPDEERAEAVAKWKAWLESINSENM